MGESHLLSPPDVHWGNKLHIYVFGVKIRGPVLATIPLSARDVLLATSKPTPPQIPMARSEMVGRLENLVRVEFVGEKRALEEDKSKNKSKFF